MGDLLLRPLSYAIRWALDVRLPMDVYWVERHRDRNGESMLAQLRHRIGELSPANWATLREHKPHVWAILARERVLCAS